MTTQYEDVSLFRQEDICFWEAELFDGTILRESEGFAYGNLPRSNLKRFGLVYNGETVFSLIIPPHLSGNNLVYRRRSILNGDRAVIFLLGFLPDGPAYAVNIQNGQYRISEDGFIPGDPEMYAPVPMPGELNFETWEREHKLF